MGFSDVYRSVLKDYPDVLTVEEMSRALGISTKTGYKLIRENKIESLKVGRSYRIPKAHLLSYEQTGAYILKALEYYHRHLERQRDGSR